MMFNPIEILSTHRTIENDQASNSAELTSALHQVLLMDLYQPQMSVLYLNPCQLMYTTYVMMRIRQSTPLHISMFPQLHIVSSACRGSHTPLHLRSWDADVLIPGEMTMAVGDKIHASNFCLSLAVLIKSTKDLDPPEPL